MIADTHACCRVSAQIPAQHHNDIASTRPVVDLVRAEHAVRELLLALGEDPDRDGLQDTPRRVATAYRELLGGLHTDPATHLERTFEHEGAMGDVVVLRDIEFFSLCEHHLLPFLGTAHVAYLPAGGRVVGLSKLARTVDVFARRPQLQERLTAQIADALMENLSPRGVAVIVEGEHMCMKMRGVGKQHSVMATTAYRGAYLSDAALRSEVTSLMRTR